MREEGRRRQKRGGGGIEWREKRKGKEHKKEGEEIKERGRR